MSELSTKPYLIRAIYDWCADSGLTPYLAVRVDETTRVPQAYVRDGEIVLNIGMSAVRNLQLGNEEITCGARFGGVPYEIIVPMRAVVGIFAKETGRGLVFQGNEVPGLSIGSEGEPEPPAPSSPGSGGKPSLRVVK